MKRVCILLTLACISFGCLYRRIPNSLDNNLAYHAISIMGINKDGLNKKDDSLFGRLSSGNVIFSIGVRTGTDYIVTTKHAYSPQMNYYVGEREVDLIAVSEELDLMILKDGRINAKEIIFNTQPRLGERIWTTISGFNKLNWYSAGKIVEIDKDYIYTEGFIPLPGYSGSPFYDSRGRLVGIVKGYTIDNITKKQLGAAIIPAQAIQNYINSIKPVN